MNINKTFKVAKQTFLIITTITLMGCSSGGESDDGVTGETITVPDPPVIGDASAGDGVASIVFTAPASNGGGIITSYTVTCTDGTNDVTVSSTISPIEVTDLTNGTTYSCSVTATNVAGTGAASGTVSVVPVAIDISAIVAKFDAGMIVGTPSQVTCSYSDGTLTQCLEITLTATQEPAYGAGPWCPRTIMDTADEGGIWLENDVVNDVDGDFIENLATFYSDTNWLLYDPATFDVNVTDTQTACEAAARPDVDPEYQNHCVECQISYMEDGTTATYTIPLTTKNGPGPTAINFFGAGLAYSGVLLEGPAPVDAILSAYTIAPFDDCGGHVNTAVGYHIHAVTDEGCLTEVDTAALHAPEIGIAMDGYILHTRANADGTIPTDLDSCGGHTGTDIDGYHYHVGEAGSNAILNCHTGQIAN